MTCRIALRHLSSREWSTSAQVFDKGEIKTDNELFAYGAMHVMALYAAKVNREFQVFMHSLFGDKFKGAPIKTVARMKTKLKSDLLQDPEFGEEYADMWDDPNCAATSLFLRTLPFRLADIVRGSVVADGSGDMITVCERLRRGASDREGRRFDTWRIKNTHHRSAKVVGGYRDVKCIGRFHTEVDGTLVSMITEVQVIDATFLTIKRHMHRPFAISRGDFS